MKQYTVTELVEFIESKAEFLNSRIKQDSETCFAQLSFLDIKDRDKYLEIKETLLSNCKRCKRCNSLYLVYSKKSLFCTNRCRIAFFRSESKKGAHLEII